MLLVGGCGSLPQSAALLQTPPAGLPRSMELGATPFFPQREFLCGPAAMATVLAASQLPVTPDELVKLVYVPEREGSFQIEMAAAARSFGRLVYPLQPQLADILQEVAAGHPVLVFQNLGVYGFPVWHFAVVIGYDLGRADIQLRSGTDAQQRLSMSLFEKTWRDGGYWARVVLSPDQLPATAIPLEVAKAAQDLHATGQAQAAWQVYQSAADRWPDTPLIWLGLGNSAYGLADYAASAVAFIRMIELQPHDFQGWNNLAYALARQACPTARQAAHCALRLGAGQESVESTVESTAVEVEAILAASEAGGQVAGSCAIPLCPLK
jgi:tetratricopeptide (TPR) repeat protein